MAKVIARINKRTGTIEFEVNGIKGSSCEDITNALAVGLDVQKSEQTQEYYEELERPDYINNGE